MKQARAPQSLQGLVSCVLVAASCLTAAQAEAPHTIRRDNSASGRVMGPTDIVALKAGRGEHPPWTMYAYERNLAAGVSLDMDIRKTSDNEIVVIHDETTGRTCDKDWHVAKRTVSELKTLDAAYHYDPKRDRSYPLRGQGLTIPTLDEALSLFAQKKRAGAIVWIDTKDDEDYPIEENQRLYDRLIELIAKYHLWREAHVEVSRVNEAEALRQRDPRVRVVFWGRRIEAIEQALRYPHFQRIGVPLQLAPKVSHRIRASGKKLHVTANRITRAEWQALRQLDPDSLATEHYSELLAVLGTCRRIPPGFERPFFRLAASGCIDDKTNIACFAVFARRKNCSLSGRRRNPPTGSQTGKPLNPRGRTAAIWYKCY